MFNRGSKHEPYKGEGTPALYWRREKREKAKEPEPYKGEGTPAPLAT